MKTDMKNSMKPIILFIVAVFLPGKSGGAFQKRNALSENPGEFFISPFYRTEKVKYKNLIPQLT